MTDLVSPTVFERYVAVDLHKDYVVVGGALRVPGWKWCSHLGALSWRPGRAGLRRICARPTL